MERSKTTTFCLSCHTMESFGKSLYVDDPTHIPAAHFQNHRVPRRKLAIPVIRITRCSVR
jgi:nitrate/TMAO reductase-like tetraheme cytochrome c subunit